MQTTEPTRDQHPNVELAAGATRPEAVAVIHETAARVADGARLDVREDVFFG